MRWRPDTALFLSMAYHAQHGAARLIFGYLKHFPQISAICI